MPLTALVVEDDADMATSYERLLRRRGLVVVSAATREAGLARLGDQAPALLVCDMRLPDGDGLDVVRAARALAPPAPVVVVTGYGSRASHEAAVAAGASSFLTKPFTLAAFDAAITAALDEGRRGATP